MPTENQRQTIFLSDLEHNVFIAGAAVVPTAVVMHVRILKSRLRSDGLVYQGSMKLTAFAVVQRPSNMIRASHPPQSTLVVIVKRLQAMDID